MCYRFGTISPERPSPFNRSLIAGPDQPGDGLALADDDPVAFPDSFQ